MAMSDVEAFEGEQGFERFADGGFVVDDEDAGSGGGVADRCDGWQDVSAGASGRTATASAATSGMYGGPCGSSAGTAWGARGWWGGLRRLRGKSRRKVVPAPGVLSTWILPACSCMMP